MVSSPSGWSTSWLRLKATAHSEARPASSAARRASRTPRRTTSIQCTGSAWSRHSRGASPCSADASPQVWVEITSQPAAT
jgi:hypothetical protein